jgi:hypothetical protein
VLPAIWQVRPLAVPAWPAACLHCAHPFLESTHRFRVNANGRRHDVWLVYACPRCGARRKHSLHRRVREEALGASLEAYRRDDAALAVAHAFALAQPGQAVAYAVERAPLPDAGALCARIAQAHCCGVRWDAFLARELGWPRARLRRAWERGTVRVEPARRPSQLVRDGDSVHAVL